MVDGGEWQRRVALQIAAQLPENTEDALLVLKLATELVETFLVGGQARLAPAPAGALVAFPAASSSSRSANGSVSSLPR